MNDTDQPGTALRVVPEYDPAPIATDAEMIAEINEHWRDAQRAYADILRAIGTPHMRWLLVKPARPLDRYAFEQFAREATNLASAADIITDRMERSARAFERREARQDRNESRDA